MSQFELFELILLLKLDKQFPAEQFEATVSQSAICCPPLNGASVWLGFWSSPSQSGSSPRDSAPNLPNLAACSSTPRGLGASFQGRWIKQAANNDNHNNNNSRVGGSGVPSGCPGCPRMTYHNAYVYMLDVRC